MVFGLLALLWAVCLPVPPGTAAPVDIMSMPVIMVLQLRLGGSEVVVPLLLLRLLSRQNFTSESAGETTAER